MDEEDDFGSYNGELQKLKDAQAFEASYLQN